MTLAATLEWTFARTYAETAPHSYVVEGRTAGMTRRDYVRAAHVIHTFGQPGKFYSMTGIYLTGPDGQLKWWTMDRDLDDTSLINQASTDRRYGVQNAPFTHSGIRTPYDEEATAYDKRHPRTDAEQKALCDLVATCTGSWPPALLDVGCGTGRMLDVGLTTPDRYAGVDPSQPMLNMLVRKHPNVAAVYPTTIECCLHDGTFTHRQFEIVTAYNSADALEPGTISALAAIASRALLLKRDGAPLELLGSHGSIVGAR